MTKPLQQPSETDLFLPNRRRYKPPLESSSRLIDIRLPELQEHVTLVSDRNVGDWLARWSFDAFPWHDETAVRKLPIGVIDSGIGGLTVLDAMLRAPSFQSLASCPEVSETTGFASERFVYFGDQANMPYGSFTAKGRINQLRDLILRNGTFLVESNFRVSSRDRSVLKKPPVKAVVMACNTASVIALEAMRTRFESLPVLVLGVVEAGARGVLDSRNRGGVGIFATPATCKSLAYPMAIHRILDARGFSAPTIVQHACPSLASMISGEPMGSETIEDCIRREVLALMCAYRDLDPHEPLGTLVLGCTHYPLVREEFEAAFSLLRGQPQWRDLIAEELEIVDPAVETAREVYRSLAERGLLIPAGEECVLQKDQFYFSMVAGGRCNSAGWMEGEQRRAEESESISDVDTEIVPLEPGLLTPCAQALLQERFEKVWERLAPTLGEKMQEIQ